MCVKFDIWSPLVDCNTCMLNTRARTLISKQTDAAPCHDQMPNDTTRGQESGSERDNGDDGFV
jgi:hypothetical protein